VKGQHALSIVRQTLAGSAPGGDLVVEDPTVSRLHAEFDLRNEGLWVRDLGSRNGTYVDDIRVEVAYVPHRSTVRLGGSRLLVEYEDAPRENDLWPHEHFGQLYGRSTVMRRLFTYLSRVAASDASVLVRGETGTGKELVARSLHEASPRASGPFIVVDCGSIPENLMESQLFGHAKGAFTGAVSARVGYVEAADGGTLFLDEVGELPLSMQPKLLRVLESRTVQRIGEVEALHVDVRVVSATHRDLREMVNAGAFREDLYFRLAVVPVTVPPLRDRADDIPFLVDRLASRLGGGPVPPELVREASRRTWMGNVRELRNFVERALAVGPDLVLSAPESQRLRTAAPAREVGHPLLAADLSYRDFREQWNETGEREYLRRLLERFERNVTAAAQAAGVSRTYLHKLIQKHGL
jgi:transcriptional regulator with GAF, ATPase, and Fis domain